ncbi:MAG: hypothetical protein EAZ30_09550 [Betaproteobacteria bacterium]|nr:MAG: hypothetical protein EAZ30_09550 [Betaproteobacteria bacterium]
MVAPTFCFRSEVVNLNTHQFLLNNMRKNVPSIVALLLGAFAAASPSQAQAQAAVEFETKQSLNSSSARKDISAVWQSPQQGYVIDMRERAARLYHITADACWPDAQLEKQSADYYAFGRFNAAKTRLKVSAALGASETLWIRLDALPARCAKQADTSPTAVLRALAQTMDEHFAFFKERGVDWPASVAEASQRITNASSDAELYEVVAKLLGQLNDPHVTLQAKVDGRERRLTTGRGATLTALRKAFEAQSKTKVPTAFLKDWMSSSQSAVNKQLLAGTGRTALEDTAFWGVSRNDAGNVGYLSLTRLKDLTAKETVADDIDAVDALLDTVIAACTAGNPGSSDKNCKAIIVDLSQNRGGDDRVALAVAARFAASGGVAFTKQAVSKGAVDDVQSVSLSPSSKPRWLGEVVLVTDSITVSAAEVLTLAMRTLPNVKHIGQPTRGALSDALEKSLPNGWRFTLSNEIYKSAGGELFEARGITPSEVMTVFDTADLFSGQSKLLTALVAKQRAQ